MLLFNYFAHPGKGSYMVVMVKPASILIQQKRLWTPVVNIWLKKEKRPQRIPHQSQTH
jgi:hypothetical protein